MSRGTVIFLKVSLLYLRQVLWFLASSNTNSPELWRLFVKVRDHQGLSKLCPVFIRLFLGMSFRDAYAGKCLFSFRSSRKNICCYLWRQGFWNGFINYGLSKWNCSHNLIGNAQETRFLRGQPGHGRGTGYQAAGREAGRIARGNPGEWPIFWISTLFLFACLIVVKILPP